MARHSDPTPEFSLEINSNSRSVCRFQRFAFPKFIRLPPMKRTVSLVCLIVLGFGGFASSTASDDRTDSARWDDEHYRARASKTVTFTVDMRFIVTAPYKAKSLKVWVPLPQSDNVQKIKHSKLSTFPTTVEPEISIESKFKNKFAFFEFKNPNGAQIIRHQFQVTVSQLNWDADLSKVKRPSTWPKTFSPYLEPQIDDANREDLETLVSELSTSGSDYPSGQDLASTIDWVNENLTYDHSDSSLSGDANHALTRRRGHCSDYHGLCATMGRQLGYPSRITYGLALYPKNSPSHCKLESYLPPYGWVSFDVSETQKMIKRIQTDATLSADEKKQLAKAARNRLMSGFRENSWLLVTKGSNYALSPPAAAKTVPLVRTLYAEADGVALREPDPADKTKTEFSSMTSLKITSDGETDFPFKNYSSLKQ